MYHIWGTIQDGSAPYRTVPGGGLSALFACIDAGLFCFGDLVAASLFGRIWNPREAAEG